MAGAQKHKASLSLPLESRSFLISNGIFVPILVGPIDGRHRPGQAQAEEHINLCVGKRAWASERRCLCTVSGSGRGRRVGKVGSVVVFRTELLPVTFPMAASAVSSLSVADLDAKVSGSDVPRATKVMAVI